MVDSNLYSFTNFPQLNSLTQVYMIFSSAFLQTDITATKVPNIANLHWEKDQSRTADLPTFISQLEKLETAKLVSNRISTVPNLNNLKEFNNFNMDIDYCVTNLSIQLPINGVSLNFTINGYRDTPYTISQLQGKLVKIHKLHVRSYMGFIDVSTRNQVGHNYTSINLPSVGPGVA